MTNSITKDFPSEVRPRRRKSAWGELAPKVASGAAAGKDGGSIKGRDVPNTRKETENLGDARGQFGLYLRHWLDRQADRAAAKARIAKAAGVSVQAVGKWEQGVSGPPMQSLHAIADVMDFANWARLATAAVRFYESQ